MGSSEKGAGRRRRAAPCRESKPGVSPPRLQHQPAMPLPPSSRQPAPFVAGEFFSLWGGVVEADGLQHSPSSRRKRSPCFGGRSPQPATGHPAPAPPAPPCLHSHPHPPPSQAWSRWFARGPLQSFCPPSQCPQVPSLAADPPFPSPAFPQNPSSAPGLTKGGSTGLPSEQRRGPSPRRRLGGPPQRLPRAGFSLWTLRPLASGRSSEPPRETSGRWEGAGPPSSKEGGRKNLPQPPPGSGSGPSEGPVGLGLRGHR